MSEPKLFIALHDVTPFHFDRLCRAEALFARWGVEKILYLLVPNYHGAHRADRDPSFLKWCRQPRPFEVDWFQHGYFHLAVDRPGSTAELELPATADGLCGQLGVGSPRSNEAEFDRLPAGVERDRLAAGREIFRRCLQRSPTGFIAPKWMNGPSLPGLLADEGYEWTEDDGRVRHLASGLAFRAPVITWATRSAWRKQISLRGCPLVARLWRDVPLLRIAMHPFDFDHPDIVDSIARIVDQAARQRRQAFYAELLSARGRILAA